ACILVLSLMTSNGLAGTSYTVNALSDRDEKPHPSQNDHDDHFGNHNTCPSQSFLVGPSGKGNTKILDVTYVVKNDEDSAIGGGYWALDHFKEHLQVWQLSDGSFYALKKYDGIFVSPTGGLTPSGNFTQTESSFGDITGGYVATFTGTFTPGTNPTRGNIGPFNYNGTMSDVLLKTSAQGPPNIYSWTSAYFTSTNNFADFAETHWGWKYTLDEDLQSSTSVNQWCNYNIADGGNSGDIKP
ncbi:MAG: hypothetical protein KGI28_08065, partial [Thaumarchaeota archaeon]|nr:hypothetical protein [Nitrososphaerota archaeon]